MRPLMGNCSMRGALERVAQGRGIRGQHRCGVLHVHDRLGAGGLQGDFEGRQTAASALSMVASNLVHTGQFGHHLVNAGVNRREHEEPD